MARGKRMPRGGLDAVALQQPSMMGGVSGDFDAPYTIRPDAFDVTKSDTAEFAPARIYCGAPGNVTVMTAKGAKVTFHNVPAGSVLPVKCVQILASGTDAQYGFVGVAD